MSNSAQMTIEEKVVQKIKSDSLMQLIGDEDAITELATRAVREAFFKDRNAPRSNGYGTDKLPSPAMSAAGDAAKTIADKAVTALLDDPEMKQRVQDLIIQILPGAITDLLQNNLRHAMQNASMAEIARFTDDIRNKRVMF